MKYADGYMLDKISAIKYIAILGKTMIAVKNLPHNYNASRELDLSQDVKLLLALNIASVGLFLLFGWIFLYISAFLRRIFPIAGKISGHEAQPVTIILGMLAAFLLALTLHEAVHGLFFFLFTGDRPTFGLRGAFAYAAAPGWYIRRNPYLIVGLSPLILISLVGLIASIFIPMNALLPYLFGLTISASGAIGDLYIVGWLLGKPEKALINDRGEAITIFFPNESMDDKGGSS